jgi:hypothetical protein
MVAKVISKFFVAATGSQKRGTYTLITSAGEIRGMQSIQTMWLAPEDAAGIKRAWAEALADDEIRADIYAQADQAQKELAETQDVTLGQGVQVWADRMIRRAISEIPPENPAPLPRRTPTPVRTPLVGDTVEWNGIKGTAGYVTEVDETLDRITVAWGNRVTKEQGTDIVSSWGFAQDWTITTMPEDAPESRPEMETRVQAILGATGEEPAIDDSKAVPYLLTRRALEMIDVRKTLEMTDAHGIGAHGLGIHSSGEVTAMDMDVPSTPAHTVYRVTLDRVGWTSDLPPLEVAVADVEIDNAKFVIAAAIRPVARKHLVSQNFTVLVDLDEGTISIQDGRFGRGKVTRLP